MDPIEIIVTSVDSLSSSPSQASYQSSPNGRSTQHRDQTHLNMNTISHDITAKLPPSSATTTTQSHRVSSERWHSTRLGGYDSPSDDHKTYDNSKRPLLSISIPNSQSSHSLHTTKFPEQAMSAQHLAEPAGRPHIAFFYVV